MMITYENALAVYIGFWVGLIICGGLTGIGAVLASVRHVPLMRKDVNWLRASLRVLAIAVVAALAGVAVYSLTIQSYFDWLPPGLDVLVLILSVLTQFAAGTAIGFAVITVNLGLFQQMSSR